jgi:1,2-diacylglycerol 3-alpha-glucosyltransferase
MRVLHVYDSISPIGGGSQIAVMRWVKNLSKQKLNVFLLTSSFGKKNIEKNLITRCIYAQSLNLDFLYPHFSISLPLLNKQINKIKNMNINIIHFHEPSLISLQLLSLAKKWSIKTITTFHTLFQQAKAKTFPLNLLFSGKKGLANKLITLSQNYLLKHSDFITAPSFYYQEFLKKNFNKKVFYLPYPIADYFFLKKTTVPSFKKEIKLITVSRLSSEKNIDLIIKSLTFLDKRFSLSIVGDGVEKRYLENKVKKFSLEKRVKFYGWIDNKKLPQFLQQHHLFVSASDFETFGITYIETLAAHLPLVVYDYPVSREVIPKKTAVFVKTFDPKIWAEKIKTIFNQKSYSTLIKNINQNYHQIEQYREKESTKKLIKIYQEILL